MAIPITKPIAVDEGTRMNNNLANSTSYPTFKLASSSIDASEKAYLNWRELSQGIFMGKCPDCMKEYQEYKKKWKYGQFEVEAFTCECGTDFRDYKREGKHKFTLKKPKKGKGWKKA